MLQGNWICQIHFGGYVNLIACMLIWAWGINRYTNCTWHPWLSLWDFNHYSRINNPHHTVIKTWVKSHSCSHSLCKALNWTELKLYTQVCRTSRTEGEILVHMKECHLLDVILMTGSRKRLETHVDMLCWYLLYSRKSYILRVSRGCPYLIEVITYPMN